jgi:hypothetical protein
MKRIDNLHYRENAAGSAQAARLAEIAASAAGVVLGALVVARAFL